MFHVESKFALCCWKAQNMYLNYFESHLAWGILSAVREFGQTGKIRFASNLYLVVVWRSTYIVEKMYFEFYDVHSPKEERDSASGKEAWSDEEN